MEVSWNVQLELVDANAPLFSLIGPSAGSVPQLWNAMPLRAFEVSGCKISGGQEGGGTGATPRAVPTRLAMASIDDRDMRWSARREDEAFKMNEAMSLHATRRKTVSACHERGLR